ncbi:MAG: Plug domain-containing protein [Gemmatimonadetes bacterium]|nr:Plug domain-containing protein [Gemmatimonadota bacterium]
MIGTGGWSSAPRSRRRIGARILFGGLFGLLVGSPASAAAQEPPVGATVVDTIPLSDSVPDKPDPSAEPDSLANDTIYYNMPRVTGAAPASYATGIWEWDRDGIMASGANTLAELVQDVPGLITLLGGDYGTPAAMTAFGLGGAGYRVIRDGFELFPVAGGVVDLQRVGLGGISRVRLDRSLGQMQVELWSHEHEDGRPFSVVEAGTGDLDTNMFRGVYADPTALFGSMAVALERIDTRSRGKDEGGNRTGSWVRYQLHLKERAAVSFDYRRAGTQTKVADYFPTTGRTDLMVRAGLRVADGVVLEGYTGRSSYDVEGVQEGLTSPGGSRAQHGGRVGFERGGFWATGALRLFEGELPARSFDASGGFDRAGVGGVAGRYSQATWTEANTSSLGARAWVGPVAGVTLFGAYEAGEFGAPAGPLMEGPVAPPLLQPTGPVPGVLAVTDRTTLRVGGSFTGWGVTVAGAGLRAESDLALPLGTELDLGAPAVGGVSRKGVEAALVLPTMWTGLTLQGAYQFWDEEGPFVPRSVYRGSFEFHRIYKETENLEWWISVGVRGHDPMQTFVADDGSGMGGLATVPFFQNWYGRVQVRVVTVRLFFGWDNFTLRRNNQNFPERRLPYARSFFALRWDMWN